MLSMEGAVAASPTKRVGLGVSLTVNVIISSKFGAAKCETHPKDDVPECKWKIRGQEQEDRARANLSSMKEKINHSQRVCKCETEREFQN